MGLIPCVACRRHVRARSTSCPFCKTSIGASALTSLATAATLALAGCGGPAKPTAVVTPPPTVDAGVAETADAGTTPTPRPPDDDGGRMQPLYGIDFER